MSLLLLALLWWSAWAGTLTVDMLDVGQGDSLLLTSPEGKRVLIDAGVEAQTTADQLGALGVTSLNLVLASHAHADHIGGMAEVLRRYPVSLFVDSGLPHTTTTYSRVMELVESKAIPYKAARPGVVFKLDDGIRLEVLHPADPLLRNTRSDLNANSVVLRVSHGDDCLLFMGDAERETEAALLHAGALSACQVLKVAHHGSAYATTPEFLAAVQPKVALISVGAGNSYGHPAGDTVARLTKAGAAVYRTDQDGHVRLLSSGHGVTVQRQVPLAQAVGEPEPAATPEEEATDCPYLASSSSEVFHAHGCGQAARIGPDRRVCYETRDEAAQSGRRPAACCRP